MAIPAWHPEPADAAEPVTVYAAEELPAFGQSFHETIRGDTILVDVPTVPPRQGRASRSRPGICFISSIWRVRRSAT